MPLVERLGDDGQPDEIDEKTKWFTGVLIMIRLLTAVLFLGFLPSGAWADTQLVEIRGRSNFLFSSKEEGSGLRFVYRRPGRGSREADFYICHKTPTGGVTTNPASAHHHLWHLLKDGHFRQYQMWLKVYEGTRQGTRDRVNCIASVRVGRA